MRKLASVQRITYVKEIINPKTGLPADSIEEVGVLGWSLVAQKGKHKVDDLVVYFEIDSIIPDTLLKSLNLWDKEKDKGVLGKSSGNVLRTKRLLGVLSQGLVAKKEEFEGGSSWVEDQDVTDTLGIIKYEQYAEDDTGNKNTKRSFKQKVLRRYRKQILWLSKFVPWLDRFVLFDASFPSFIQKTDQIRVQNLRDWREFTSDTYEETEKCEGTSATYFYNNGELGMCSRNLRRRNDDKAHFGQIERKHDIFKRLKAHKSNIAIQGEICGPAIQGNYYKLTELTLFIFDVYLIDHGRKALPQERMMILSDLGLADCIAPVLNPIVSLSGKSINDVLEGSIIKSKINPSMDAEGRVFKSLTKNQSFKAINNNYLLKQK